MTRKSRYLKLIGRVVQAFALPQTRSTIFDKIRLQVEAQAVEDSDAAMKTAASKQQKFLSHHNLTLLQ